MELSQVDRIIAALGRYSENDFSGAIKIGFEYSRCSSIVKTNMFDVPFSDITKEFSPENFLRFIGDDFFGSVIYLFEKGKIVKYSYSKNYKGDVGVNNFLQGK